MRYYKNVSLMFSATALFMLSCSSPKSSNQSTTEFDKQAHRGGRGLVPENTIESGYTAIDYDCTMEMDLQMSKDKKIVVSHDPYFNFNFCTTPEGQPIAKEEGNSRLLFNMTYDSIRKYDTGLKPHPEFPDQKKMHTYKPLLSAMIDSIEKYSESKSKVARYNIEIKSDPKRDGTSYSSINEYVDLTVNILKKKNILSRTMLQCFDERVLQILHKNYPEVKVAYLVAKTPVKTVQEYIAHLGFQPDILSPAFEIVTPEMVKECHTINMKIIPWTPNTKEQITYLKSLGVDGIITDYPNLF